jgi:hypothetical protein
LIRRAEPQRESPVSKLCLFIKFNLYRYEKVWELKPLLNGQAVMKAVGMTKGGPALGRLNEQLVDWQLEHPEGTEDEAAAYLQVIGPAIMEANRR